MYQSNRRSMFPLVMSAMSSALTPRRSRRGGTVRKAWPYPCPPNLRIEVTVVTTAGGLANKSSVIEDRNQRVPPPKGGRDMTDSCKGATRPSLGVDIDMKLEPLSELLT